MEQEGQVVHFKNFLDTVEAVAISGGLPSWASVDYYASLVSLPAQGNQLFWIALGAALQAVLESPHKPTVIKPNNEELSQLLGKEARRFG